MVEELKTGDRVIYSDGVSVLTEATVAKMGGMAMLGKVRILCDRHLTTKSIWVDRSCLRKI